MDYTLVADNGPELSVVLVNILCPEITENTRYIDSKTITPGIYYL